CLLSSLFSQRTLYANSQNGIAGDGPYNTVDSASLDFGIYGGALLAAGCRGVGDCLHNEPQANSSMLAPKWLGLRRQARSKRDLNHHQDGSAARIAESRHCGSIGPHQAYRDGSGAE